MKRSVGVTLVGVLILVLSALMLMGAVLGGVFILKVPMATQTIPNALPPEQMRMMSIMGIGFWGLMAAFGVAIGVGILRLWSWARYTAIVVGFLLSAITAVSALVMLLIPFPETPGAPPGFTDTLKLGMGIFYLFWTVLFTGISIYLLRSTVGEQFRQIVAAGDMVAAEPKPLAVWTVAGLALFAPISLPYIVFLHVPMLLFGVEISGIWGKVAFALWMLLFAAVGVGLIRRVKSAVWAGVALYATAIVNSIFNMRPGVLEHYFGQFHMYGPYPTPFNSEMLRYFTVLGMSGALIPIALLLIGKRKYFSWCERKQVLVAPPQV